MPVVLRKARDGKVTFFGRMLKTDTKMVVNDTLHVEDDFMGLYYSQKNPNNLVLEPPYNPLTLMNLLSRNNTLSQCIEVMEVNIDGTGAKIEPMDQDKPGPESEKEMLEEFFKEVSPGVSMLTVRKALRVDQEATGNAYMEILCNPEGKVMFLRYLDTTTMRLVKYDDAVLIDQEITRGKDKIKAKVWVRERRYAQRIGKATIYFKEFGASRDLNRLTGEWAPLNSIRIEDRASEVYHFTVLKDSKTPYGIPRWINNLPSVLGSRKSEEFNLSFFDAGGIPPAAIFIQGGAVAADVKEQLNGYFGGGANASKHRVALVEIQSTSGAIDAPGNVGLKVERFGSERTSDALFQDFEANAESRIRASFRLPPIFFGLEDSYNFATASMAYMVTEAQVFGPERNEFDEIMNTRIIKKNFEIDAWKYTSTAITLTNLDAQLQYALPLIQGMVEGEELVETVNEIAGLNLQFSQKVHDESKNRAAGLGPDGKPLPLATPPVDPNKERAADTAMEIASQKPKTPVKKSYTPVEVMKLVGRFAVAMGIEKGQMSDFERGEIIKQADMLDDSDRMIFNHAFANRSFVRSHEDEEGLAEIADACNHAMHPQAPQIIQVQNNIPEQMTRMVKDMSTMVTSLADTVVKAASKSPPKVDVNVRLVREKNGQKVQKVQFPDGREVKLITEQKDSQ